MQRGNTIKRFFFSVFLVMAAFAIIAAVFLYITVFASNVNETRYFHIPTGSSYQQVKEMLANDSIVANINTFNRVAQRKNYPNRVMPGRYLLIEGMSNNALINLLRSGEQAPVRLTITNIRTVEELAASLAVQIELEENTIYNALTDSANIAGSGLTTPDIKLLFIPNTYEVFWNINERQLIVRMQREYNAFWNEGRLARAAEIGMTPEEVGILASIVQSETNKQDEMATIAGVYMNRLARRIPLQADPTVVYALGDFTINRVLNSHLEIDSPYNTYRYAGLPPGPINLPEPATMDAVLNYEQHDYLFFSAKADFSGYHVFARTYREHLRNAREYQQALNERRIFR